MDGDEDVSVVEVNILVGDEDMSAKELMVGGDCSGTVMGMMTIGVLSIFSIC